MLQNYSLESNSKTKFNFNGGDMSSDSGNILLNEFFVKIGLKDILKEKFIIKNDFANRTYSNSMMLFQQIMLIIAGYHNQSDASFLKDDPVFKDFFDSLTFASQANFSRFIHRLTEDTEMILEEINGTLLDIFFDSQPPEYMIFDIDSTHFQTYGKQENRDYNAHYQAEGFHPLMVYEAFTGYLLKSQLRPGNYYTSRNVADFMKSILKKYQEKYPDICRLLRGDSGFATPELYEECEKTNTDYIIRLKLNSKLIELAAPTAKLVMDENRLMEEQVALGEFIYKAGSWDKAHRVVVQVKRKAGEMVVDYMFIVTTLNARQQIIIDTYKKRGTMENMIKESKNGFRMDKVSHKEFVANSNRMQISTLAYNLIQGFKELVLPEKFKRMQIETLRYQLLKVAAKKVKTGRKVIFKICSYFVHQEAWFQILENIKNLKIRLE